MPTDRTVIGNAIGGTGMKNLSNRALGNSFESELCEILSQYGFWCHNLKQNQSGQPADIIAARKGRAYLIDAKLCTSKGFPLSRVEDNQDTAMTLWKECGNGEGWFALKLNDTVIVMIPHIIIQAYRHSHSVLSFKDISECGKLLGEWVKRCK